MSEKEKDYKKEDYEKNRNFKISRIIKYIKYLCVFVLTVIVLFSFSYFKDELTVENLRYLIKYLDLAADANYDERVQIVYEQDTSSQFEIFKNDLAVLKKTGLTLYDFSGDVTLSQNHSLKRPAITTSDQYLIAYDVGGKSLYIYNSFSKLYEEKFDYPILKVDSNKEGYFCVVTSSKGYHSVIYIYNDKFERIYSWSSTDKFVVDAVMSEENKRDCVALTTKSQNGDYLTSIIGLTGNSEDAKFEYSFEGKFAVSIHLFKNGNMAVMFDDAFRIISPQGEEILSVSVSENGIQSYIPDEKYVLLALGSPEIGVSSVVNIYNSDGEKLRTLTTYKQLYDAVFNGDNLNILLIDEVLSLNLNKEEIISAKTDLAYKKIFIYSYDKLALVSDTGASIIKRTQETEATNEYNS